ncbi:hypothetical protein [Pararhodobacter sp. SW119]|uniref:hypothetical protein n=1 Tax=Pararhodobacter sp. SW119 TaxID=2780075 RepID=UPI001ADFF012|nr:hypothetical protein [Pararhodobacter sp. SW119]
MRAPLLLALPALALLAACADRRGDCVEDALEDVRIVEELIVETERNIARGFATQAEPTVRTGVSLCLTPANPLGICTRTETEVRDRPVAIDVLAERRKLRQLQAREAELRERARLEIAACEARFPG